MQTATDPKPVFPTRMRVLHRSLALPARIGVVWAAVP